MLAYVKVNLMFGLTSLTTHPQQHASYYNFTKYIYSYENFTCNCIRHSSPLNSGDRA